MNIGINGYEAVVSRFGLSKDSLPNRVGSSELCYQLLLGLNKIDKNNTYYIYLPTSPTNDMPKESENWKYIVFSSIKLWTLLGLSRKLKGNPQNLDVFFSPTHYSPISNLKSVIAILDVSYLHFKSLFKKTDLYKLKYWGGYSIQKASKVITISNSSKSDIIKSYRLNPEKVVVVYPGIKSETNSKSKMKNSKKYILFVGTLQPRKNLVRLIEAFSKLNSDLELLVIGKKGWQYEEILDAPKRYGVSERIKFLHDVSEGELPQYYKNAEMLVLPSLYEGFGLPVLEAMSYGCPIITSNRSSLPEAGGDAVLYVDPENVSDIAEKMNKLLSDDSLRQELIKKGNEQVKKFSWEKAAKETLRVLENVANG